MTDQDTFSAGDDFRTPTRDDWRKLVDKVLKGAPFQRLESKTADGLTIEPLYERAVDAKPFGGRAGPLAWTVMQRVDHPDPAAANAQALEDLENGAKGLVLVFAGSVSSNGFGLDASAATLARVLDGVQLDAGVAIDLNVSPETRHAARDLAAWIPNNGYATDKVEVRFSINPIGGFAASGRSPRPWRDMAPAFAAMVGEIAGRGFRGPFAVADGRVIHNAGGSEAQELAFALGSAVDYMRALEAAGMALDAARSAIYFRLAADADQFMTMAKFRAVRKLWARVEEACGLSPRPARVTAETAWRMLTKRDPDVNMLRNAIAVAAAGLGGADAITMLPHTAPLGLPDTFARRVARNTQLVLLEESNLARVEDPAAGSGALEAITEQLCVAAWKLFQDIEKNGGVWAALESGSIQRAVGAVRKERQNAVAYGKETLTGTNAYANLAEAAPAILDVGPVAAANKEPPTDAALPRIRLAKPFERLRDASDKILAETGARPKIFLAILADDAYCRPLALFAKNFFELGGIEALEGFPEMVTPDSLVSPFRASGLRIVCICGDDMAIERDAAKAAHALTAAGAKHIYLSGKPGALGSGSQQASIDTFIYNGCNVLATLSTFYDILSKNG
jgi:methylmalonyl-CoA mutase